MNIAEIKPQHINEYYKCSTVHAFYNCNRDLLPSTYLEYAKDDLTESDSSRALINSVGNAKRALHLQVELLCDVFGWRKQPNHKNPKFPMLLEYLGKCGVLTPAILGKINTSRNNVEHKYIIPKKEEAADYIDIVELFIIATKAFLDDFPEEIEYELMMDDCDPSLLLPEFLKISIKIIDGGITISSDDSIRKIEIINHEYFSWLTAIIEHYRL